MLMSSLSVCKNVLQSDFSGQHCAPSELSILQQLEEVVVMPNYHRLFPGGARKLFNIFGSSYCDEAAKRLACWVSLSVVYFLPIVHSPCLCLLVFFVEVTKLSFPVTCQNEAIVLVRSIMSPMDL